MLNCSYVVYMSDHIYVSDLLPQTFDQILDQKVAKLFLH